MNLLLDTHVLVWAESLAHRLGPETQKALLDPSNVLLVSPITCLEIARLVSLSRLTLTPSLIDWLDNARIHLGFVDAPFTPAIAIASYQLPGTFHKDPADRIIVATARVSGCHLVTADEMILNYPHVQAFDAKK